MSSHTFGDVRSALHDDDVERLVEMAPMMTVNEIAYVAQHDNPYIVSAVIRKYSDHIASQKHSIKPLIRLLPKDIHLFLYNSDDNFTHLYRIIDDMYPYDDMYVADMQSCFYVLKSYPGSKFCPNKFVTNELNCAWDQGPYSKLRVGRSIEGIIREYILSSMLPGELKYVYVDQYGGFTETDMKIDPFIGTSDGKIHRLSDYLKGHRG